MKIGSEVNTYRFDASTSKYDTNLQDANRFKEQVEQDLVYAKPLDNDSFKKNMPFDDMRQEVHDTAANMGSINVSKIYLEELARGYKGQSQMMMRVNMHHDPNSNSIYGDKKLDAVFTRYSEEYGDCKQTKVYWVEDPNQVVKQSSGIVSAITGPITSILGASGDSNKHPQPVSEDKKNFLVFEERTHSDHVQTLVMKPDGTPVLFQTEDPKSIL